jgi:hypothetical protein
VTEESRFIGSAAGSPEFMAMAFGLTYLSEFPSSAWMMTWFGPITCISSIMSGYIVADATFSVLASKLGDGSDCEPFEPVN